MSLEPGDIEFAESPADIVRRLRRIYDNARTTVEERGVTTLHLTFGVLRWRDDSLGESTSPLWMVPAQLISKGPNAPLRLSLADEEMQLNPALELYLRETHKIILPQIPEDPDADSLLAFFEAMKSAVQEQKWEPACEIWLSTFSFESLVIYQDLKALAGVAVVNRIVAALAGAWREQEKSERLPEDLDSLPTPEIVPVPILPTDSSQLEALSHAASGRSVVMHGPPGTGKSQTISNLAADSLARNRKVLFVSAKMAALNVIFQRLAERGLGRFCLEAHSTKAGKVKIIDELRRTLECDSTSNPTPLSEPLEGLLRVREQLNSYVRELHKRWDPLGLTVYKAIGRLARRYKAPDIQAPLPWTDPLKTTGTELQGCLEALADLGSMAAVFDVRVRHPWRGFSGTDAGIVQREAIESDLRLIAQAASNMMQVMKPLEPFIWPQDTVSLAELKTFSQALLGLSQIDCLPQKWWTFSAEQLGEKSALFESAGSLAAELNQKAAEYQPFFDLPFRKARDLLAPIQARFKPWHRRLSGGYWRWRSDVRRAARPGAKVKLEVLRRCHDLVDRLCEIEEWFQRHSEDLLSDLGGDIPCNEQALKRAAGRYRVAASLQEAFASTGRVPREQLAALPPAMKDSASTLVATLPGSNPKLAQVIGRIASLWPEGFVDGVPPTRAAVKALVSRTEEILAALQKMREWAALLRVLQKCSALGLEPFVRALGETSATLAVPAFERRFYQLWASTAIENSDRLRDFSPTRQHGLVERFRSLDEKIRHAALREIQAIASEPARRIGSAQADPGSYSEVGILQRELQKKKRIKPLRKLFAEIPHVLQALKPCMLMSPISVSTYLKPDGIEFDLVIFDEASQLPTAEAIPSILRAKQVVVAGDSNQLPPTSFFEASLPAEEDEAETDLAREPLESLLDDCVAIVPMFQRAHLKWHYRSRDERLIKFSNHYFYENGLITFPSVSTSNEGRGVRLLYVNDGVWDRGRSRTNRREAREVARLIIEQVERYPDRSIGVAAMNTFQREAIEDALNDELGERPDLRPLLDSSRQEPFFVKSLENVQGDERDTILISVGYGKDSSGALTLNFGPLNMEGGWRRLNVLVTRAKWQTILVTSLRSHELHGVNPQNRGAVALKNFIEYAERSCALPYPPPSLPPAETNDFEDAVREALIELGMMVDPQVGASRYRIDLALRDRRDPSRYVLGIECDGATYHSSRAARDRDLLRQQILRQMGWRIHRVWSTEWFHDRDNALLSILRSVEQAEASPPEELVEAPIGDVHRTDADDQGRHTSGTSAEQRTTAVQSNRKYPGGIPYQKYRAEGRWRDLAILLQPGNTQKLTDLVTSIVEFEGPIHHDLIIERLKQIFGIDVIQTDTNAYANIQRALYNSRLKLGRERSFVMSSTKPLPAFRLPADGVRRSFDLIAPEEIELAILHIVEDQFGVLRQRIPRILADFFGVDRVSPGAADRIGQIVSGLIERGLLRASGYQVHLA